MAVNTNAIEKNEPYRKLAIALSVIVPVAVGLLFGMPKIKGYDFGFLPPVYASLNGMTAILLVAAFVAIKNGNRRLHERLMKTCLFLSSLFLILYVIYHITTESTPFGAQGAVRYIYFFFLITHILLSIGVIPMVLFTFIRALGGNFERHRALARFTFPLWLYVAVSGVIVYLMISPYYD